MRTALAVTVVALAADRRERRRPSAGRRSVVHAALRRLSCEPRARHRRPDTRRDGCARAGRDRRVAHGRQHADPRPAAVARRARRDRRARRGTRAHAQRPTRRPKACAARARRSARSMAGPLWNGWGPDTHNTRFQRDSGGITAANVANLKLKWAFGVRERHAVAVAARDRRAASCSWRASRARSTRSIRKRAARTGRSRRSPACAPRSRSAP